MSDTPAVSEHARARSKRIFGAAYRAEVGAAIADGDGIVCLKDLAKVLGDPPGKSNVNAELSVLLKAGLLARVEKERGDSDRRVYLIRQPSVYWKLCREIRDGVVVPDRAGGVRQ